MKGLLLKDFYMAMKYCRAFLLIALVFAAVSVMGSGNAFFTMYPVLLASMIPVTLISYDERSGWNSYADALPYTRSMLVSAKYLLVLLVMAVCTALCIGAQLCRMLYTGAFNADALLQILGLLLSVGFFAPSVMLPVIFKLGLEKGRLAYYAVIVVVCAAAAAFFGTASSSDMMQLFSSAAGIWIAAGASAILFSFSWILSIQFYRNREL